MKLQSAQTAVQNLTCSMSTLSACSKVVRLWRSFIASLSSASLRSSIRRSAASSCLCGEHESVRTVPRAQLRRQYDDSSNRHT